MHKICIKSRCAQYCVEQRNPVEPAYINNEISSWTLLDVVARALVLNNACTWYKS